MWILFLGWTRANVRSWKAVSKRFKCRENLCVTVCEIYTHAVALSSHESDITLTPCSTDLKWLLHADCLHSLGVTSRTEQKPKQDEKKKYGVKC